MTVWIGIGAALAASAVSWPLSRRWGTVVVCVPFAAWMVAWGVASSRGLSEAADAAFIWSFFGIITGTAMGTVAESIVRRRWPRHAKG